MKKLILIFSLCVLFSCDKHSSMLVDKLGNDCINRYYYVPYIVGTEMEFAYAMYMPKGSGRLEVCSVQCSIPGAEGTFLENNAYSTDDYGQDKAHRMGEPCTCDGKGLYTMTFDVDTVAATLRFHYIIPEEARGKNISFHFKVKASGQEAEYITPEYHIRKMDMVLDIPLTRERCWFCMETMKAYTAEEADQAGVPIDFVWFYTTTVTAKDDRSVFANPARIEKYSSWFSQTLPLVDLRDTQRMYRYTIIEPQLGRQEFDGFYIDDVDFETLSLDCDSDGLIGINSRNGFWMETADGKYKAYVYCNTLSAESCTISVKRYKTQD